MRPDRRVRPGERRRDPKSPDARTRRDVPTWAARDRHAGVPAPRGLRVPPRPGMGRQLRGVPGASSHAEGAIRVARPQRGANPLHPKVPG